LEDCRLQQRGFGEIHENSFSYTDAKKTAAIEWAAVSLI